MSEFRRDPITGRWVIIATERQKRPSDFRIEPTEPRPAHFCPFCAGSEDKTPPEVLAYRPNAGPPNSPGWDVRVVPNRVPALQVEGGVDRRGEGIFDRMNGIGAHEVIIETPDHMQTLATMPEAAIEKVLWAFRDRMVDLKQDRRLRCILVFKNHGAAAGAALAHSHSQLIALPLVPHHLREEVDGARRHHHYKERCVFCDIVHHELRAEERVLVETAEFVAVSPYAPRFPFETWVLPRHHRAFYEEAPRPEFGGLARTVKDVLQRMNKALLTPPYNLIVHSSPFFEPTGDYYHWHVEIVPALTKAVSFERGGGFHLNPVPPEEAAKVLRETRL
jgi:UDPglucose--hexose-1-phosphate uridylyltransferase